MLNEIDVTRMWKTIAVGSAEREAIGGGEVDRGRM